MLNGNMKLNLAKLYKVGIFVIFHSLSDRSELSTFIIKFINFDIMITLNSLKTLQPPPKYQCL